MIDYLNNKTYLLIREILQLLESGLKERIQLICPIPSINPTNRTVRFVNEMFRSSWILYFQWSVNELVPKRNTITFGVIFSEQFDLTILKGPESGTAEV